MISQETIKAVNTEARTFFAEASGCHDWTHVERVRALALKIGAKERANLEIVEIAALLHDIGRQAEMQSRGAFCHAQQGAELASKLLPKYGLAPADIDNICHAILTHRYRNSHVPVTVEAKVLFDADKLDSIGALGIARAFLFAGNAGSNTLYSGREVELSQENKDYSYTKEDSAVLEYEIKLKKIKNKMLTPTGRALAEARHDFMKLYFDRFWQEVGGQA